MISSSSIKEQNSDSAEELVGLIDQLDDELHQRLTEKKAVLFTDVQGSSAFFKAHGDAAGRSMLQKHNNLLFPVIEEHDGVIIKTIGDSIMASFNDPKMAVQSAVEMQKRLFNYNENMPRNNQIHIRIGVNFGDTIVEDDDIFGNVVNMTSRILSVAKPDHVFVSQNIYDMMKETEGFSFRTVNTSASLEGTEKIRVYEVIWREDTSIDKPPSVMTLRVVSDRYSQEKDETRMEKWAESCFDFVIPIIFKNTNRLSAKSGVELLSIFEDPITPVEVAREMLNDVRNRNAEKAEEETIEFQVFINTGDGLENDKEEDDILIDKIADARSNFDDVFLPNEIYITSNTYNFLKDFEHIESKPAALTSEGEIDLYQIRWKDPKQRKDKRLFKARKYLEAGNYPKCFYCDSKHHSVGSCPSKSIWDGPSRLRELGHKSFNDINALFAGNIDSVMKPYNPAASDDRIGQKPVGGDLTFDAFYELTGPFQLYFLKKIWLSKARRWSEIEKMPKDKPGGGRLWLGLDCIRVSKLDQAETLLEGELKRHPNDYRIYLALGFLGIERGDLAKALDYFERAMESKTNTLQKSYISLLASRVCEITNRFNEARQKIEETLALAPDCLEARYRKAVLMARMGEYLRGVEELRSIIKEDPRFYVKALLDPNLMVVEDRIEIFLFELFSEAKREAMRNKPKAVQAVEKLKKWFGVTDEKYGNNKADLDKILVYMKSKSCVGFMDAASIGENILYRSEMILNNHRNRVRRDISSLSFNLKRSIKYIRKHPYRKRLGELGLSIKRINDEVLVAGNKVGIIRTHEEYKEARETIQRLSAYSKKVEPVIKKLRRIERIIFFFGASKKISIFVIGGLAVGSILFPLMTYYIAYFFSDFNYVIIERLWRYQKMAVFLGIIVGFIAGVAMIAMNIFKNKNKSYTLPRF